MKAVSKGIVLRTINYSETSAIAKILTHNYGLRSFLIRGVKSKRKKTAFLQPLGLVELEYAYHANKDLITTNSIKHLNAYHSIPHHPHKTMVAFFLAEMISESIKSDQVDETIFDFLHSKLMIFDLQDWNPNFHLYLLARLTRFLGFFPLLSDTPERFDMENGAFGSGAETVNHALKGELAQRLLQFFTAPWEELATLKMNRTERQEVTLSLVTYYQLHSNNMRPLKSLDILTEVLSA